VYLPSVHLGPWSLLLLLGAANGALLAVPLMRARVNRTANRLLAALILLTALRLGPYILGYAGAYDAHRWLTFAPFDFTFAFGPLLWGYVVVLTAGALPRGWRWHLVPVAIQFLYSIACFALPLDAKWDWYTGGHLHLVDPLALALLLLSFSAYLVASWRQYRRYLTWLDDHLSNNDEVRLAWLRNILLAFAATVVITAAFAAVGWFVRPLDFFDRFPVMVWLAGLTYFLGLAGWRDGERRYPLPSDVVEEPPPVVPRVEARVDYAAVAAGWVATIEAGEWWRDETLTRERLAERLGTSPRTLSRALNEGRNQTFHDFINGMRVRAVQRELENPASSRDLLQVALDAGFSSKASFNRVFKAATGMTPSGYREMARSGRLTSGQRVAAAAVETLVGPDQGSISRP
jgi:AraC-like DNA-binding protein